MQGTLKTSTDIENEKIINLKKLISLKTIRSGSFEKYDFDGVIHLAADRMLTVQ